MAAQPQQPRRVRSLGGLLGPRTLGGRALLVVALAAGLRTSAGVATPAVHDDGTASEGAAVYHVCVSAESQCCHAVGEDVDDSCCSTDDGSQLCFNPRRDLYNLEVNSDDIYYRHSLANEGSGSWRGYFLVSIPQSDGNLLKSTENTVTTLTDADAHHIAKSRNRASAAVVKTDDDDAAMPPAGNATTTPAVHATLAELEALAAGRGERSTLHATLANLEELANGRGERSTLRRRLNANLTIAPTGAECYAVSGGLSFLMGIAGNYERMDGPNAAERPFCGQASHAWSVYRNGDHYLLQSDASAFRDRWYVVSGEAAMENCAQGGSVNPAVQAYAAPGDQPDGSLTTPWKTRTGADTEYKQCNDATYCAEANLQVTDCSTLLDDQLKLGTNNNLTTAVPPHHAEYTTTGRSTPREQQLVVDKFLAEVARTDELPASSCPCGVVDAGLCALTVTICVPVCIKSLGTACKQCIFANGNGVQDCCNCVGRAIGSCSWCFNLEDNSTSSYILAKTDDDDAFMPPANFSAPILRLLANEKVVTSEAAFVPVVFLHGMGDSGSNAGMKSICKTASDKYPGLHSVCSNVANGMSSITTELHKQLDEFTAEIRADPLLKDGFTAVGLSQGNLVLRAYIEKVNDPPVHKWVSICGPNNGIGTCPKNALFEAVCPVWKLAKYNAPLAFSDYWKDSKDESGYLAKSRFLADLNNEKAQKNATYKANFASLTKLVLVEALNDTMVVPHASESFGFWKWGESGKHAEVVPMRDTIAYKDDYIGLRTLDEAGKVDHHTYVGDHLRFSDSFWSSTILPYFKD